jgi:glycosyltransferase involved in cell wall biosynthesis
MRLAICSVGELFGGVERQILDLCTYHRREGHGDPIVILFHDGELARHLRERGFEPTIVSGRNRYDRAMIGRSREILTKNEIDVVHVHGYKATVILGLAKRGRRFRLVKTEHGKPETILANLVDSTKLRLNFLLEQIVTRLAVDHVCYVTKDIQNCLSRYHAGISGEIIHNGIDPLDATDYSRPEDLPDDRFNVGIVGRVTPIKGIRLAIEALSRPEVPEHVHVVVIGTGNQVEELKQQAAATGTGNRVHMLGFRKNILDYLAHIDVLLMPSLHEGLPYTLLEAMSLARPVIASRVGGLEEVLRDGETGILVKVGAVDEIAAAIRRMVRNPDATLGINGQRELKDRYTLDAMGRKYVEAYR